MVDYSSDETLRSLVAFSAAQAYSVNTNNPFDVVLPLFQPIAAALHGRQFVASDLGRELSDRYDLRVSEELCQYWAQRLVTQRLLVAISQGDSAGALRWEQGSPITPDHSFQNDLATLIASFREFLQLRNDLISSSYSDADLALILRRGAIGSLFPKLFEQPSSFQNDEAFVFSRFTQWLAFNRPHLMDVLSKLRRAAIYCDLILHVRAPRKPPINAQLVSVYFDSPLVMDAIGLSGPERAQFATRLLAAFKELKFVPLVNEDMLSEIVNNINGLIKTAPGMRYGPTAEALRTGKINFDIIKAKIDRLWAVVEAAGITIDKSFASHTVNSAITDEMERELFSRLQNNYKYVAAAQRDAQTIRGVFGRRGGTRPTDLYGSRAIFITANDMVTAVANRFFREVIGYSDRNFPVVVSRPTIAALTDAVSGVEDGGHLSMSELLVSAEEATQYNVAVFVEIERVLKNVAPDNADELAALIELTDFSSLAMDLVRGNPRNVSNDTIDGLVAGIKKQFRDEASRAQASQRAKEKAQSETAQASLREALERRQEALATAVAELKKRDERSMARILEAYDRLARWSKISRRIVGGLAVVTGVVVAPLRSSQSITYRC